MGFRSPSLFSKFKPTHIGALLETLVRSLLCRHESAAHEVLTWRCTAADLEEAAATGQKLEYGWTSINFLLPAVLLFSDAIFGLAAGMTVKCALLRAI